ncbi:MAG TPA: hypothetical protein VG496_05120, partial [Myxococcales bacterium]|nr:hypothetical protein [Myxococcales bacterium]
GLFALRGAEGRTVRARQLWEELRREAPPFPAAALDSFGAAIAEAERTVSALATRMQSWPQAVEAVLRIESAFTALARTREEE